MRQINSLVLQADDTDKEFTLKEGTEFLGCQIKNHEVIVWYGEPDDSRKTHTVFLSCFAEYGAYGDEEVHIGLCSNIIFTEDETFHVTAKSPTTAIWNKVIVPQAALEAQMQEVAEMGQEGQSGEPSA